MVIGSLTYLPQTSGLVRIRTWKTWFLNVISAIFGWWLMWCTITWVIALAERWICRVLRHSQRSLTTTSTATFKIGPMSGSWWIVDWLDCQIWIKRIHSLKRRF